MMGIHPKFWLIEPEKAIGKKIRYYTWFESYLVVKKIDTEMGKVYGDYFKGLRTMKGMRFNLCKGITRGGELKEHWNLVIDDEYKLDEELFKI